MITPLLVAFLVQMSEVTTTLRPVLTIGEGKETVLFSVAGAAVGKSGIYVTDNLQFSLLRFKADGIFLNKQGRRGSGPGEFRSPHGIAVWRDTVVVFERSTPIIHFFDSDLKFLGAIKTESLITDVAFDSEGALYTACYTTNERERVVVYNRHRKRTRNVTLRRNILKNPLLDMIQICVDRGDNLILAYVFVNKIEVYDKNGTFMRTFSVPGLPDEAELKEDVPTDDVLKDVTVDGKGNILVLRGGYSEREEGRRIYVFDTQGAFLYDIFLPERSRFIQVDSEGYLYVTANDGITVKKYKVIRSR